MASDDEFIGGMTKLKKRIATIRERLGLPSMVNEIGELLLRRTLERFDRQVDPDYNPWPPLTFETRRTRRSLGYPELPALNRSGLLRSSIQMIRTSVAAGSLYINTGSGVRIGVLNGSKTYIRVTPNAQPISVARVGRMMQNGTPHIPARRFLGIGRLDIKSVDSFLRRRGQQALEE